MRATLILCIGLAVLVTLPHPSHSQSTRTIDVRLVPPGHAERVYMQTSGEDATLAARDRLARAGAVRINCFLPDLIVCDIPSRAKIPEADRAAMRPFDAIRGVSPADERSTLGWAMGAYARAKRLDDPAVHRSAAAGAASEACVVRTVPRDVVQRTHVAAASRPEGRGVLQNAEILVGNILVHLIFPESGAGVANNEDWTDGDLASAATLSTAGLLYWQIQYDRIDLNFIIRRVERASTSYEPIKTPMNDERLWVSDVMTGMGYPGQPNDYLEQVHAFNEEKRVAVGADWAFSAFIVDSDNDADHRFEGAPRNAWAYLGGPHFVLPHPVAGPREGEAPPDFEQNFIHQFGHIFWALDEQHRVLILTCASSSGYLNESNGNKQDFGMKGCFGDRDLCVMNLDDAAIALYDGPPCQYTSGMFGLKDDNLDGVPDAIDAPPTLEWESSGVDTVLERTTTLRFKARSRGVRNRNPHQAPEERVNYLVPVKLVARSLNGVPAEQLKPLDGDYDGEIEEDFAYEVTGLQSGMNTLKFVTRNSAGATSDEVKKRIFYLGLTYLHFEYDVTFDGVKIKWNLLGSDFGANFEMYRVDMATGEEALVAASIQPAGPGQEPFTPYAVVDNDQLEIGRLYEYYVRGTFDIDYQGRVQTMEVESEPYEVRAALPIAKERLLSYATPNPFNQNVWTSINVPASTRTVNGDESVPARTAVEVVVYDVAGRYVNTLLQDQIFGQIITIGWDGTNRAGDQVPSGVYFIQAIAGPATDVRKVVLVR